jgi:hypothetical protein
MKIIEGKRTKKLKKLLIKKYDRQYRIDTYDIREKDDCIVISGYDLNDMYFQIKHTGKYKIEETEDTMFIELK